MAHSPSSKQLTSAYDKLAKQSHPISTATGSPMEYQKEGDPYAGLSFGSEYEKNVYAALRQLGWPVDAIDYQVPIYGGRGIRGGLVVDFVLYTPSPIPMQVQADWWHRDGTQEVTEQAAILERFRRLPIMLKDVDADTLENALSAVMREIGRYG